jgi:hypothetical protein
MGNRGGDATGGASAGAGDASVGNGEAKVGDEEVEVGVGGTTAGAALAEGAAVARACAVSQRMRPMRSTRRSRDAAAEKLTAASSVARGWVRSRPHVAHTVDRSAVEHAGQTVVSVRLDAERGKTTLPADAV